jgi:uncharacterized low-complexity protein
MGKRKDAMRKLGKVAASSAVALAIMGFTPGNASANAFNYNPLGSGADVRTVISEMNQTNKNVYELACGAKAEKTKAKKGEKSSEAKCGEGKCGEKAKKSSKSTKASKVTKDKKASEAKCGEGKCGEGKCGAKAKKSTKDAKAKKEASKTSESKCGEGKCGN